MKNLVSKSTIAKSLLSAVAAGALVMGAQAQTYSANITTTVSPSGGGLADRLFLDAGATQLAPVGTRLWFVADTAGNGLPSYSPLGVDPSSVLGADDVILYTDVVDGQILGSQPGRFQRNNVTISTEYQTAPIYAFLWGSGNPLNEAGVGAGDTFGTYSFGVQPPPAIGNAAWYIGGNMNGSEYAIVTPVPEPSTVAFVGVGLAALALFRTRRNTKLA